jgi:hypothetical protein
MDYLSRSGWMWHELQSLILTATTPRICRRTTLCFKHVRINGKCPAGVTSRNIPPHRPTAIRQGLSLRQAKASSSTCALHLIESTRARIVQGEQDYSEKPHGEHSTSRARRFCALMDSNVGDSIREPHVVARMRLPLRTLTCSAGFSDMQTSVVIPSAARRSCEPDRGRRWRSSDGVAPGSRLIRCA